MGQDETTLVKCFVANSYQQEILGMHTIALYSHVHVGLFKLKEGRAY